MGQECCEGWVQASEKADEVCWGRGLRRYMRNQLERIHLKVSILQIFVDLFFKTPKY